MSTELIYLLTNHAYLTYLNLNVYDILLLISIDFRSAHYNDVDRGKGGLAFMYFRWCAPFGDFAHADTSNLQRDKFD